MINPSFRFALTRALIVATVDVVSSSRHQRGTNNIVVVECGRSNFDGAAFAANLKMSRLVTVTQNEVGNLFSCYDDTLRSSFHEHSPLCCSTVHCNPRACHTTTSIINAEPRRGNGKSLRGNSFYVYCSRMAIALDKLIWLLEPAAQTVSIYRKFFRYFTAGHFNPPLDRRCLAADFS